MKLNLAKGLYRYIYKFFLTWAKAMAPHSSTLAWKNPMDGGAWWAAVHGVAKSQTRLSNFTFTFHFHALEKAMATHSRTGEPAGLPSMGLHSVGHDWSNLAAAAAILWTKEHILTCLPYVWPLQIQYILPVKSYEWNKQTTSEITS